MNFHKYLSFLCLFLILSFNQTRSQTLGILYEASSFSADNFIRGYSLSSGMIKNIFVDFDTPLYNSFHLSIKAGYGWSVYKENYSGTNESWEHEISIDGFPVELDIEYQSFLERDSVFEPLLGLGIGYYDYAIKNKFTNSSDENDYRTTGFANYILFGMNIHITNQITTSIQFKKFMTNSISTTYENTTSDYEQKSGISDLAISLGIFFNL